MEDESWKDIARREVKVRACNAGIAICALLMLFVLSDRYKSYISETAVMTGITEEGIRQIAIASAFTMLILALCFVFLFYLNRCMLNPKTVPPRRVILERVDDLQKEVDELKARIVKEDSDGEE